MQMPYKIRFAACTSNTSKNQHCKTTTGVVKPQADSEGSERIPPDGFDTAALEVTLRR